MAACYAPPVDDGQRTRLLAAHTRVEHANTAYERALGVRRGLLLGLRRRGVSVTSMAAALGIHRTTVQREVTDAAGPAGGLGVARGVHPTPDDADALTAAQAAIVAAEAETAAALDARNDVYIALAGEQVGPVEQAQLLGVHRMNVQRVLDEHRRWLRRKARTDEATPGK